jgi:hypothetical protein
MPYGEATLSWTRNGEADLAGYRVYGGLTSNDLELLQDVGLTATPLTPSVTITNFPFYGILFFAVAAYDTSNNQSPFSTTVSKGIAPKLFPLAWG